MKISIIIVNYNVRYFLEQCLHSVLKASRNIDSEIFVVDNNSTDGSREWLEPSFPAVNFIWQKKNIGFAKANNIALRLSKGSHVVFLNPDTIVPEDCFSECLEFFANNPSCGAVGVRMIDGSGKFLPESKRSFPTAASSVFKMMGLATLFPKSRFARYHAGHLPEKKANQVDVLAGAFFMAPKKLLEGAGGFDEDFFMYGEDIDLSYRMQQSGFKNYYFPGVTIIHFKGESTQKLSLDYVNHFYGAMSLFVKKHQKSSTSRYLLLAAIKAAAAIAGSRKLLLKAVGNRKQVVPGANETLVIGTHEQFNRLIQLLKHAVPAQHIIGRLCVDANDRHSSLGYYEDVETALNKYHPVNIILCEGALSFRELMRLTEQLGSKALIWFHSEGSDSIISSHNKSGRGEFVSADKLSL